MNPLETQLRAALAERAPDTVDTTGWAEAARARAARARARVATVVALVAVLVVGIAAVGLMGRDADRATLPSRPVPPVPARQYAALCTQDVSEAGPWGDVQTSLRYAAVALCPVDPSQAAWAQLPSPALLTGTYLDRLVGSSGPPVENCELGRPQLPSFRLVAVDHRAKVVEISSGGERCGGALLAQSFAVALAQQAYDASHPRSTGCAGLGWGDGVVPPQRLSNPTAVHVCVMADPAIEAEPAPLRYRPLRGMELTRAQWEPLLSAMDGTTTVRGRYTTCPWRHAVVQVVTSDDTGARVATLFLCQQDFTKGVDTAGRLSTMRGTWPVLPGREQQLLTEQASAYLSGRATP